MYHKNLFKEIQPAKQAEQLNNLIKKRQEEAKTQKHKMIGKISIRFLHNENSKMKKLGP